MTNSRAVLSALGLVLCLGAMSPQVLLDDDIEATKQLDSKVVAHPSELRLTL
jgi:hypothetical protein